MLKHTVYVAAIILIIMKKLSIAIFLLFTLTGLYGQSSVLDEKVSLTVYKAETIESVVFRLAQLTGKRFGYRSSLLSQFKGKHAEYEQATVKDVLDDQLDGTLLSYRIKKKQLEIFLLNKQGSF